MYSMTLVVLLQIISTVSSQTLADAKFRILAPQFVCPKDKDAVVEKPDNTIITLQTATASELQIEWTVRWLPLVAPTQRFTLMLWRTVRALEKQLNGPQPEPLVYVIENSDLLPGVNYIFNVRGIEGEIKDGQPKSFSIDNTQGDQKLMIEGRNDMLSIILVGAQTVKADTAIVFETQVTTCYPMQDYYFSWSVIGLDSDLNLNVSEVQSSKLEIPPFSLKTGCIYNVLCKVIRHSNGDLITKTNLPFKVTYRGLGVQLNVNYLIVPANRSFVIESTVINHDYYDVPVSYKWQIYYRDEELTCEEILENDVLIFTNGLPFLGKYKVTLTVTVLDQSTIANATVVTVPKNLPVIKIDPMQRILNEGSKVSLVANASNVTPTCTLSWYFTPEDDDTYEVNTTNGCDDCQHGKLLTETLTIYSLEEQFLSELADFTNETEWRQVTTSLLAEAGRARFVAQCGCSLTFSCDATGTVYADLWFQVNESPKAGDVMVSPNTGTALETIFRISTLAVLDPDTPLQYSFYCKAAEEKLLLASYFEHRAVETLLPYVVGGTEVWVEVCDSLGACSNGKFKRIILSPTEGRTVDGLIQDVMAHVKRCELNLLERISISALVTYANNQVVLKKFSNSLQISLSAVDQNCISRLKEQYSELISRFERLGIKLINN